MLLLLLMYLSPVVAVSVYWYAQRTMSGATAWETIGAAAQSRMAMLRPTAGAFLFGAAVVALAVGIRGGIAFLFGATTAAIVAALASSTSDAALETESEAGAELAPPAALPSWPDASALALSLAAIATGCIGALAWFFADPAGAVVLAAFACGASAAALFLAMVVGTMPLAEGDASRERASRSAFHVSVTASLHSHLPAIAATIMIAATAEPETLLPLGGLLAETETLRSELLLLPIAVSVLSPVVAMMAAPLLAALRRRRDETSLYDLERLAALLSGLAITLVLFLSGLAWPVAGAFAVGLLARQLAVFADEARSPVRAVAQPGASSVVPALLSAAALLCGDHLAGWYGIALVALGMTATYPTTSACTAARELAALEKHTAVRTVEPGMAETTAGIAATLALLVATAPVIATESLHRGAVLMLVATAAPALLIGVIAGAAGAQGLSRRFAEPSDEAEAVRQAAQAVAIAAGLPALAGAIFGAAAAIGVALGFAAWAVASAPLAAAQELAQELAQDVAQDVAEGFTNDFSKDPPKGLSRSRMPASVMLAWGRTMALAALVGAPLMN